MYTFLKERIPFLGMGRINHCLPLLLGISASYFILATTIGLVTGFVSFSPSFSPMSKTLSLSWKYLLFPAIFEELFWRWLWLNPRLPLASSGFLKSLGLVTVLFVLEHPIVGYLLPFTRSIFWSLPFLAITFLLGLACACVYNISQSIWPAVALHWSTILCWKFLFGGPLLFFQS